MVAMSSDLRVAVVGATGAVGRMLTRILEERDFPVGSFVPLASQRSAGTRVPFRGEDHAVGVLSLEALSGADLALVSAGAAVSRSFIPEAAAAGTNQVPVRPFALCLQRAIPLSSRSIPGNGIFV